MDGIKPGLFNTACRVITLPSSCSMRAIASGWQLPGTDKVAQRRVFLPAGQRQTVGGLP